MLKTIIIDDEIKARETIQNMLETYCPDVEVIASAGSVKEGLKVLEKNSPDLVFLDVEMPHGSGFDLLANFPKKSFDVIFITAFK